MLVIIDGGVDRRVGDEVKEVQRGDRVFIPMNTLHGPMVKEGQRLAALSVFGIQFDRSKDNIDWERDP